MKILTKIRQFSHTLQTKIQANLYRREDIYQKITKQHQSNPLQGFYDAQGFRHYYSKNQSAHYKHLLTHPQLKISSIGVGTYKGSCDTTDDLPMFNGLVDSLDSGCNVLDSCRNFRGGRSEIVAGQALNFLVKQLGYSRNNFFLSSKAGYVRDNLPASVNASQVANDHCVHPSFLKAELQQSIKNLGVKTIDVYYLNNFAQSQMQQLQSRVFFQRLEKAFAFLQNARATNLIKFYGLSSWQSFRLPQTHPNHLSLEKVLKIAEKIGGSNHGFKFVQMPINILMPEAFAQKYTTNNSFLDVAQELKVNVVSNSPLLSGSLINIPLPAALLKCNNNGAKHLQLIRSIPSRALVSTLVGQKLNRHVKKNLQVFSVTPLDQGQWLRVFVPSNEARAPEQQRETL